MKSPLRFVLGSRFAYQRFVRILVSTIDALECFRTCIAYRRMVESRGASVDRSDASSNRIRVVQQVDPMFST